MAVVNQVGVSRRSFIIDINYDYEVWNQPVISYAYNYAHFDTGAPVARLEEAMRRVDATDPRRQHRAAGAVNVVRIAMNVSYMLERDPAPINRDSVERDAKGNVLLEYELELDRNGIIVGGEWLYNTHPDFLWIPEKDTRAISVGDRALDQARNQSVWSLGQPVPVAWRQVAPRASERRQPLARVVEQLIRFAQ
jgi:hypothetical protein